MSISRIVGPIVTAAILVVLLPPLATIANNFGSNTASGGTGAFACSPLTSSQCVANNGTHLVKDLGLNSAWRTAMNDAVVKWNNDPSVVIAWTTATSFADVWAYNGNFGDNGIWGWTACLDGSEVVYGGSDPDRWCYPQLLRLNDFFSQTANQKKSITCHELGHTLGLRHSNESSGTCMIKNQRTILNYSSHDSIKLDQQY